MSTRPPIPWTNYGLSKHGSGIRYGILRAFRAFAKAHRLKAEAERLEKEELDALTRFEPFGKEN